MVIKILSDEGENTIAKMIAERAELSWQLFGAAPTGKRLSIKSITVERVSDGKIIEHWRVTDEICMLRQLGVFGTLGNNPAEPPLWGERPFR